MHIVLVDEAREVPLDLKWITVLREVVSAVLVLAMINDPDDAWLLTAMEMGIAGYLTKPCSYSQISSAVATAINGGISISSDILKRIIGGARQPATRKNDFRLSRREEEVVRLLVDGKSVQEIAEQLSISYNTADTHLKNIHRKLGVSNSRSVISIALREEIVRL